MDMNTIINVESASEEADGIRDTSRLVSREGHKLVLLGAAAHGTWTPAVHVTDMDYLHPVLGRVAALVKERPLILEESGRTDHRSVTVMIDSLSAGALSSGQHQESLGLFRGIALLGNAANVQSIVFRRHGPGHHALPEDIQHQFKQADWDMLGLML